MYNILMVFFKKHYIISLVTIYFSKLIIESIINMIFNGIYGRLIISGIIIIISIIFGYFYIFGFKIKNILKGLYLGLPFIFAGIFYLLLSLSFIEYIGFSMPDNNITGFKILKIFELNALKNIFNSNYFKHYYYFRFDYYDLFNGILFMISVGIYEEIFFRGIILNILMKNCKRNKLFLIVIASIIFGITHLINLVNMHEYYIGIISQMLYTIVIGIFLSIIYIKYNNIWPVIIIHIIFNCMSIMPFLLFSEFEYLYLLHSNIYIAFIDIIISLFYLLYSIKIYKKLKIPEENVA